jgi:hypothetical protein
MNIRLLLLQVALVLPLFASSPPAKADDQAADKQAAVTAMGKWLGEIDAGSFADSWDDSAPDFQKALSSQQWVDTCGKVRIPLGKILSRKLDSELYQASIPKVDGPVVIAQFDSSFENLKFARETVTFEKVGDTWKASGYYIKPR